MQYTKTHDKRCKRVKKTTTAKNELQTCDWVMRKNARIPSYTESSGLCCCLLHSIVCSLSHCVMWCVGLYRNEEIQITSRANNHTNIYNGYKYQCVSVLMRFWISMNRRERDKKGLCYTERFLPLLNTLHHHFLFCFYFRLLQKWI